MNDLAVAPQDSTAVEISPDQFVAVSDAVQQSLGRQAGASVGLVNDLLGLAPPDVAKDLIASGIFSRPHVVRWVAALLQTNEALAQDGTTVEGEIARIEHLMRTNRTAYNRDEALQARYRILLASR